jgi:hypothetical protein
MAEWAFSKALYKGAYRIYIYLKIELMCWGNLLRCQQKTQIPKQKLSINGKD